MTFPITRGDQPNERPNVLYRMYDVDGQLLYVGITMYIGQRFDDHRAEKAWWREIALITLEHFDTRSAVEQAERAAIMAESPCYNKIRVGPKPPRPAPEPGAVHRRLEPGGYAKALARQEEERRTWEPFNQRVSTRCFGPRQGSRPHPEA